MVDDEKALYDALVERGASDEPTAFVVAMSLGMEYTRVAWILQGWHRRGLYVVDGHWGHGRVVVEIGRAHV